MWKRADLSNEHISSGMRFELKAEPKLHIERGIHLLRNERFDGAHLQEDEPKWHGVLQEKKKKKVNFLKKPQEGNSQETARREFSGNSIFLSHSTHTLHAVKKRKDKRMIEGQVRNISFFHFFHFFFSIFSFFFNQV